MGESRSTLRDSGERRVDQSVRNRLATLVSRFAPTRRPSANTFSTEPVRQYKSENPRITWGLDEPERYRHGASFAETSPAGAIDLERQDGTVARLDQLAGLTTMVLLVSQNMCILPGIGHRIVRRSETLGQGVNLVCVTEQAHSALPTALIDRNRNIRVLGGGYSAPILLSLDARGNVFDVVSDANAIMDWLWNDPRPHSMRANGAMELDDVMA